MIDDGKFEGKVKAHLLYAASMPWDEGIRILGKHLDDGTWEKAPIEWFNGAWQLTQRDDAMATYQQLLDRWLKRVARGDVTEAVQLKLTDAVAQVCSQGEYKAFLTAVAEWFTKAGRAGHAGTCASVLERIYIQLGGEGRGDAIPDEAFPLVQWLLQNGAAELRSTKRHGLVHRLVEAVYAHGAHDLLEVALRYLVHADHAVGVWSWNTGDGQWPIIEAALQAGTPPSLALDIAIGVAKRAPAGEQLWRPLLEPERFPMSRMALVTGLAAGAFPEKTSAPAWRHTVGAQFPQCPPRFTRAASLEAARKGVSDAIVWDRNKADMANVAKWAAFISGEVLRIHEAATVLGASAGVVEGIGQLMGWDESVEQAIADSLREVLEEAPSHPDLNLAREVLAGDGRVLQRVRSSLHCLPVRGQNKPERPKPDLGQLRDEFARVINLPWHEPVFGIPFAAVLGSTRTVRFEPLPNSAKVAFEGDTLLLDPDYYHHTLGSLGYTEEARQLCSLYFFHELIHVWQGLGAYSAVQDLRSTGAEMTLMHVDISADHAATMMAVEAVPKWDLLNLKDLTGRSLSFFPASTFHTEAARHRKAVRLVSHRVDYLARRLGIVPADKLGDGYVFADYGPAGGRLLVLVSGPPPILVKGFGLTAGDAKVLLSAADDCAPGDDLIAQVDGILRKVLAGN